MKKQIMTGIDGKRVVIQTPETDEEVRRLCMEGIPGPVSFGQAAKAEAHDERWVTLKKSEEGKGRKLLLDDSGNIIGGDVPKSAQGKSLKEAFTELKSKVTPKPLGTEKPSKKVSEETAEQFIDKTLAAYGLQPDGSPLKKEQPKGNLPQGEQPAIPEEKQIKAMNKKLRIAMFGKDLDDPSDVAQKQREEAKDSLVKTLVAPLSKNEAVLDFVYADMGYTKEEAEDKLRRGVMSAEDVSRNVEFAVNSWIHGWAETSADNNPKALAMQRAAQEVFNLTEAKTGHFPVFSSSFEDGLVTPDDLKAKRSELEYVSDRMSMLREQLANDYSLRTDREAYDRKLNEYSKLGEQRLELEERVVLIEKALSASRSLPAYKAFLKAQYDETQAYFKKHGITHLNLYRGMGGVPLPEKTEADQKATKKLEALKIRMEEAKRPLAKINEELFNMTSKASSLSSVYASPAYKLRKAEQEKLRTKYSAAYAEYRAQKDLLENRPAVGEADLALQPISSFSTSYRTARGFGSGGDTQTVIACVVPVEHILSTAKTGFGCLSEGEVTVLAHKLKGKRITQSRMGDLPQTEAEFLSAVGKLV